MQDHFNCNRRGAMNLSQYFITRFFREQGWRFTSYKEWPIEISIKNVTITKDSSFKEILAKQDLTSGSLCYDTVYTFTYDTNDSICRFYATNDV